MAHTVCGVCFSLNKSTSYLAPCLPLNSFCNETSRTWASLGPETRSVISVGRPWTLPGFESQPRGFKSQSEGNGFRTITIKLLTTACRMGHAIMRALDLCTSLCLAKQYRYYFLLHPKLSLRFNSVSGYRGQIWL